MNNKKTYTINVNYSNNVINYRLLKYDLYDYILSNKVEDIEELNKIKQKYNKVTIDLLNETQNENGNIFHYIMLKNNKKNIKVDNFKKIINILKNRFLISDYLNFKDQFGNYPLAYTVDQNNSDIFEIIKEYLGERIMLDQIYDKNKLNKTIIEIYKDKKQTNQDIGESIENYFKDKMFKV